ncbi:acid sphingomyelinase-like phosphodiesterase 3b [Ylistrum balloti]|uniref:acid sphingomyelinase-like phosphodiesterase 3b n=1 Tax=Ylistrum balloti TaxID=509963 RepID=UPI002905BF9E|nr:acid sphingomyelinase-like phosphodiesterase 3b [Ylistrum balloti]
MPEKRWIRCTDVYLLFLISLPCNVADEGWFWHVTDFHYDFSYSDRDLSCSDSVTHHGEYGDYWCDAPWRLIESSVKAMKRFKPDVDFILWTGDSVLHAGSEYLSIDINVGILSNITNLIVQKFGSTPIYATLGNNDFYPDDDFPPTNNELYNRTLKIWETWINGDGEKENFLKGGFYTTVTSHGIRVVALNTNLYYRSNKLTEHITDPADQFTWLENILTNATTNKEKVLITGHVSPGVVDSRGRSPMYEHFNRKINYVIQKYADVIIGLHFGHEHADTFLVYKKSDVPIATMFLAPSVTPWRYKTPTKAGPAHNPAIRLVQYDRLTGRHLNMITYYMDLPASNAQGIPQWAEEYNATRDYNIDDLSPNSMNKLAQRMSTPNSPEFNKYWKWRFASVQNDILESCDEECKTKIVCQISHVDQSTYDACVLKTVDDSTGLISSLVLVLTSALLCVAISS